MRLLPVSLVSAGAILASVGTALAADPVVYEPAPAPEVIAAYDWGGVYVGIQGGYGWADLDDDEDIDFFVDDSSLDLDGGFLGVYAGYNYQWDNFVLGIEADINKAWMDEQFDFDGGDAEVEIDWAGSAMPGTARCCSARPASPSPMSRPASTSSTSRATTR
jgi:outer membrane immunogenic protein